MQFSSGKPEVSQHCMARQLHAGHQQVPGQGPVQPAVGDPASAGGLD